jgi:hypothetical protein
VCNGIQHIPFPGRCLIPMAVTGYAGLRRQATVITDFLPGTPSFKAGTPSFKEGRSRFVGGEYPAGSTGNDLVGLRAMGMRSPVARSE